MKRVGIITYPNIEDGKGRFLQAYALYSAIEELGYVPEVLNYVPVGLQRKVSVKRIIKRVVRNPKTIYGYIRTAKDKLFDRLKRKEKLKSKSKYREFIEKNMNFKVECVLSVDKLKETAGLYDAFVCGSDQIWNPYFTCGQDYNYYLTFAPYGKRIAYAASMGTIQIEKGILEESVKKIANINYCSVREKETKELLEKVSELDVCQVCDPTFLKDRAWWDNLASAPRLNYKYVLTFLFDNNQEPRKKAYEIAKEKGIQVVSIQEGLSDVFGRNIRMSGLGPEEFVSLFKNAEYICTQSFHGTVLSLIFQKDFLVFDRSESGQVDGLIMRISNLLKEVGLEDRIVRAGKEVTIKEIDYKKVEEKLDMQRKRSKGFLVSALEKACKEDVF